MPAKRIRRNRKPEPQKTRKRGDAPNGAANGSAALPSTDTTGSASRPSPPEDGAPPPALSFPIVGIGASAGGLEAFTGFLKNLPPDTGLAFVLVQHMDPKHESMLHRLLAKHTAMPVAQVENEMPVEPNHVYVTPPDAEMTIHGGVLKLVARSAGAQRYTPIDTFFVLDVSMPLLNGIMVARRLRSLGLRTKIVFCTMHADPGFVREAFDAGAAGYVVKSGAGSEVVEAIHRVLRGDTYVSPRMGELITDWTGDTP